MTHHLDRRKFLRLLSAAGVLPLAPMAPAASHPRPVAAAPESGSRRIVVLGAGLAGLCAGYNLMNDGYDVTILEAQDRPGDACSPCATDSSMVATPKWARFG